MLAADIGGGSLLIAWQLKGKKVLIIGGGEVAGQRVESILSTDAHITVISLFCNLHEKTQKLISQYPLRTKLLDKMYEHGADSTDLLNYDMVLTALDDFELSKTICHFCREHRIPVNAADIPGLCDFYFGSQIRDGPLQIMISTNGNGPKLANLVKGKIAKALSGQEGAAIKKVGALRVKLRERAPGVGGELGKRRMSWMTKLCKEWTMEELGTLNEENMQMLLDEGWENDKVPSAKALGVKPLSICVPSSNDVVFPGFIGFCVGIACVTTWNWLRR
ncbi:hypothetical protein D9756_001397 [Leucocoprinus leucothites]|uniref:precorrin-2 dehydrogenase n=1 Tax=Leucocoprinus leucothites TaxID=201217 RepID=A0A8H5G4L7_9AGAR|nr:hypothetical protein D9756_001397 [Leucoagaricus leucothites]